MPKTEFVFSVHCLVGENNTEFIFHAKKGICGRWVIMEKHQSNEFCHGYYSESCGYPCVINSINVSIYLQYI